jgi:isocitrate lyase
MAITHQKFVGTGYFDRVMKSITDGDSSVGALEGSTEEEQFQDESTVESSSVSESA